MKKYYVLSLIAFLLLGACSKEQTSEQSDNQEDIEVQVEKVTETSETREERHERELAEIEKKLVAEAAEENEKRMIDLVELPLGQVSTKQGTLTYIDTPEELAIVGKLNELAKTFEVVTKKDSIINTSVDPSAKSVSLIARDDTTRAGLFIHGIISIDYQPNKKNMILVEELRDGKTTYTYYNYDMDLAGDLVEYIYSLKVDVPHQ